MKKNFKVRVFEKVEKVVWLEAESEGDIRDWADGIKTLEIVDESISYSEIENYSVVEVESK